MAGKTVLITGSNVGLGKDSARQFAESGEVDKVYLAVRTPAKGEAAAKDLAEATGKDIFEVVEVDTTKPKTIKAAIKSVDPIDIIVMNAGGVAGDDFGEVTDGGVTYAAHLNLLGHAQLTEGLIKAKKLNNTVVFVSSEIARGIPQMRLKKPTLDLGSEKAIKAVLAGKDDETLGDQMQMYGAVKRIGTLWASALARKHPELRVVSVSPGGTSGTDGFKNMKTPARQFYTFMSKTVMPLFGFMHSLDKGAERYVQVGLSDEYATGSFYASGRKATGPMTNQSDEHPEFDNEEYQDNAYKALHSFM